MPLFGRPDGTLVKNESPVRRMIPYLMLGRNESALYHEQFIDLTKTKPWIHAYNHSHEQHITLFHLMMHAMAQGLYKRPGMNRFVSGKRIYQRSEAVVSFAAKKKFRDDSPLVTLKMSFSEGEAFETAVKRIVTTIDEGRVGPARAVDKEVKLALSLPGWLLSFIMSLLRRVDRWNLMPKAMIDTDPMYASLFLANLGSLGIDNTFHHLYEYGNCSLFAVVGVPKKFHFVSAKGETIIKDGVNIRWTFDERINDGFYCFGSMRYLARMVEDPEKYLGSPTGKALDVPADAANGTAAHAHNGASAPQTESTPA